MGDGSGEPKLVLLAFALATFGEPSAPAKVVVLPARLLPGKLNGVLGLEITTPSTSMPASIARIPNGISSLFN